MLCVDFYPPNSGHSDFGAVGALPAPAGALSNGSGSSLSNLGSSFGSTGGNGSSSSRSSSVGSSGLTPSGQGNGGAAAAAGGGPVNGLGLGTLFCTLHILLLDLRSTLPSHPLQTGTLNDIAAQNVHTPAQHVENRSGNFVFKTSCFACNTHTWNFITVELHTDCVNPFELM